MKNQKRYLGDTMLLKYSPKKKEKEDGIIKKNKKASVILKANKMNKVYVAEVAKDAGGIIKTFNFLDLKQENDIILKELDELINEDKAKVKIIYFIHM